MSRKTAAVLLCVFVVIAAIISGYRLSHMKIESSVLSLLPQSGEDSYQRTLENEFIERLNSQVIFAVGAKEAYAADKDREKPDDSAVNLELCKATDSFIEELKHSPYLKDILARISDEEQYQSATFVYRHKTAFITEKLKNEISDTNYSQKLLSKLYSGFSGISSAEITHDLLLVGRNLGFNLNYDSSIRVENNQLTAYDAQGRKWALIFAALNADSLSTKVASEFVDDTDRMIAKLQREYHSVEILKKGAVFYSDYAASTSQKEITLLGLITTIGIFALIFFVFRSFIPVFLTIGSVLCGIISALFFTCLVYDEINLIIIGMCISVIGIVCDYTIYFTTLRIGSSENSFETIKRLCKPLSFAVLTDLCAYLIILLSPVKSVSQMAFFCMCTISFACIFVILVEPFFLKAPKREQLPFESFFSNYLNVIRKKSVSCSIITLFCGCSLFAFFSFTTNDDPISFQKMPDYLKSQEQKINTLLNTSDNLKYLLINAKDDSSLLEKNEIIRNKLDDAQSHGLLGKYLAMKINSEKKQNELCVFLNERKNTVESELQEKGILIKAEDYTCEILKPQEFFSSTLGSVYKNLYYSTDKQKSLMIVLEDIKDAKAIREIASSVKGCSYVDTRGNLTEIFRMYRVIFFKVIAVFMLCILVITTIRVGFIKALAGTGFSVLSIGMALFALTVSGYEVNLFSELGIIVLLGIGINYNIFMSSSKIDVTSIIAIFTALLTTLMTIGILIFSSVDAIKCFAICLTTGIICAFILSALMPKVKNQHYEI